MKDSIEQFIQQAKQLLPGDSLNLEFEKNLRALANSTFSKMGVVSRDEFDAQSAVLARTREKLEQLEQQLDTLNEQCLTKP